jgi:hypothetical protein
LGLILLAASAAPAPSRAATLGTAMVSVVVNDQDPQTIDVAAVDPDVGPIADYPFQSPTDPQGTTDVESGVSVTRLIRLAGADPANVTSVEIINPATGLPVVLTQGEVRKPSTFLDGLPAVFLDQTEAGFLRPLRTEDDMNTDDAFIAPAGEALQVHISSPPPLEVHARVSATATRVGRPLTFFVTATGGAEGEVLTARWNFGDGQTARVPLGATPHVYRHPGVHRGITVTVHGDLGSGGSANIAKVTVKRRPTAEGPPGGSGNGQGGNGDSSGVQGGVAGSTTDGTQPTYTYTPPTYGDGTYGNGTIPTTPVTPPPTTQPTDPGRTVTGTVLGDQTASTTPAKNGFSDGDSPSTERYTRLGAAAIGVGLLAFGAFRELRTGRRKSVPPTQDEPEAEQETADAEAKHET